MQDHDKLQNGSQRSFGVGGGNTALVQIWIKGQIQEYFSSFVNIKRFFIHFNLDEKILACVVGGYLWERLDSP